MKRETPGIKIVQAVGRALRPHKDKKMSYIIVPVLIDEDVDDFEAIKNKTFEAILQIIRALATHDERIIEYFRALSSKPKRAANRDYFPCVPSTNILVSKSPFVLSAKIICAGQINIAAIVN